MATRNKGKLVEFEAILGKMSYELVGLDEVKNAPEDVEETGRTFEENAQIKAKAYGEATGIPVVADDSGLEVDALGGRPGVSSARYAPTVEERNRKLLKELKDVPREKRTARFVSVVCYFDPKTKLTLTAKGSVEGEIAFKIRGVNGFGYDPIFIADELGKTFGEASDEEKNKISHRARALGTLRKKLESYF